MSKAAELAALIGSQTALENRNLVINGAMQVAQRATEVTGVTTEGYKAVDRWQNQTGTLGTFTMSQSTTSPDGFAFSQKYDCTTADASPASTDFLIFQHRIEAQNLQHLQYGTSGAKRITLSFHVRSNKTGTYIAELSHGDATSKNQQSYTINSANTWEKKTLSYVGQTSDAINNDNGIGMFIQFWLGAGSAFTSGTLTQNTWANTDNANRAVGQVNLADSTDNEWYITGVQLELGEQATPFEHRSFGDELRRCQRYYETSFDSAPSTTNTSNNGLIASGGIAGDTTTSFSPEASATYKVSKRAVPTVTFYDLATGRNTGKCHRFQLGAQAHDNSAVTIADSGLTRFNAYSGSGNACSGIAFHYEADAEL
jgi:hypothetical protein